MVAQLIFYRPIPWLLVVHSQMDPLPSLGGCNPSCQMQSKCTLKEVPVWARSFKRPLRSTQPSQTGCTGPKNGVSRPLLRSNLGYGLACLEKQQVSTKFFRGSKKIAALCLSTYMDERAQGKRSWLGSKHWFTGSNELFSRSFKPRDGSASYGKWWRVTNYTRH